MRLNVIFFAKKSKTSNKTVSFVSLIFLIKFCPFNDEYMKIRKVVRGAESSDEEGEGSWEKMQIRKGITGPQVTRIQCRGSGIRCFFDPGSGTRYPGWGNYGSEDPNIISESLMTIFRLKVFKFLF